MFTHVHFRLLISVFIYSCSSIAIAIFSTMLTKKNSLEQANKLDLLNKTPNAFSNMQMVWVVEKVVYLYELLGTNPRFFSVESMQSLRVSSNKGLRVPLYALLMLCSLFGTPARNTFCHLQYPGRIHPTWPGLIYLCLNHLLARQ